jgi:hypothetical protein
MVQSLIAAEALGEPMLRVMVALVVVSVAPVGQAVETLTVRGGRPNVFGRLAADHDRLRRADHDPP